MFENRIACGMAEIVVDALEAIEIDEQAGKFRLSRIGMQYLLVQHGFKTLAVQKPGQVVGNGLEAVALFRLTKLGDVRHHAQYICAGLLDAGLQRLFGNQHIHRTPIGADEADGELSRVGFIGMVGWAVLMALAETFAIFRMEEGFKGAAKGILTTIAGCLHPIIAHRCDTIFGGRVKTAWPGCGCRFPSCADGRA